MRTLDLGATGLAFFDVFLQLDYDEKKHQYDTLLLQLESGMSRLEQEVKKQQEEIMHNETKYHTLEMQTVVQELWLERAQQELKAYVSSSNIAAGGEQAVKKENQVLHQLNFLN